ncbi:IS1595 family transposase [Hymenobacter sp. ASUV-10]|uniref:IS1595 family transposase n=1 Tax=Hymenobacter aranciens TaxID=3063996 RepID=A0ABT9B7U1_9BACT|nr:IS1595 family transposase [Hymenobacter sp. ASUV-10]MDO7874232.1 IS1595 family transposase [Hymenobacter sp. ASUV-10]
MARTKLPLTKWLRAVHLFYTHRSGVSAQILQREIEVTYKVAWRMGHQIRSLMADPNPDPLRKIVEVDETYVGGRKRAGSKKPIPKKTAVFGTLERGGRVRTTAVQQVNKATLFTLIQENVELGTTIYSDEHSLYTKLPKAGYPHDSVLHKAHEWRRGNVTTNAMEGHWSRVKRTIRGAYVWVSPQWLQSYLDECSFLHNRRHCPALVVEDLLARMLRPLSSGVRKGPPGLRQTPSRSRAK